MSNYIVVEDEFGNILAQEPIPVGLNTIPITIDNFPAVWNGRAKVYTTGAFNNCETNYLISNGIFGVLNGNYYTLEEIRLTTTNYIRNDNNCPFGSDSIVCPSISGTYQLIATESTADYISISGYNNTVFGVSYSSSSPGGSTTYKIHDITITNNSSQEPITPPTVNPPISTINPCPSTITSNYTASIGDIICANTSINIIAITIPETANPGDKIIIKDPANSWSSAKYLRIQSGPLAKVNYWLMSAYWSGGFNYETPSDLRVEYISDAYGWEIYQGNPSIVPYVPPEEVTVIPPTEELPEEQWPVYNSSYSVNFGSKTQVNVTSNIIITLPTTGYVVAPDIYIKSSLPGGSGGTITYNTGGKLIAGNNPIYASGPWGPGFNHRLVWVSEAYGWDIWQS